MSDTVAVWMLFHPRKKVLGFQGAIPKNQARLAKSLGKTVGERLLTPADIMSELQRAGFREMLDGALATGITSLLETERGSLREILPPTVLPEVERALDGAIPLISARLDEYLETPAFEEKLLRFIAKQRAAMADTPVGEVLTPERRARLTARASQWAEELAHSPELERGVREYIERHATSALASASPIAEKLPAPVVKALEQSIDAYLPRMVEMLARFLQHPASRERIRTSLHELFGRLVNDLRFHQRVIARLVVTEETLDRALDSIEQDGVEQLATLLEDPEVRGEITHSIHEAVMGYLRKPISELVGASETERARAVVDVATDYLLRALRADETRALLVEKLDSALERAEDRTWGELLSPLDDRTIARWVLGAARSDKAQQLVEDAARAAARTILDKPIGRPGRWLPPDSAQRLGTILAPAVWTLIDRELPLLIARLDVQAMVERKVLAFSVERLEELIKGVIQRELRLIIFTGYVLGGLIAIIGFAISAKFGF